MKILNIAIAGSIVTAVLFGLTRVSVKEGQFDPNAVAQVQKIAPGDLVVWHGENVLTVYRVFHSECVEGYILGRELRMETGWPFSPTNQAIQCWRVVVEVEKGNAIIVPQDQVRASVKQALGALENLKRP